MDDVAGMASGSRQNGFIRAGMPAYLCIGFIAIAVWQEYLVLDAIGVAELSVLVWMVIFPLCCLASALLLPRRWCWKVLLFFTLAGTALTTLDRVYYMEYQTLPAFGSVSSLWQAGMWNDVYHPQLSWFALIVLLYVMLLLYKIWRAKRVQLDHPEKIYKTNVAFGFLILFTPMLSVQGLVAHLDQAALHGSESATARNQAFLMTYSPLALAARRGLYNYHFYDLYRTLASAMHSPELDNARMAHIKKVLDHRKLVNGYQSPLQGVASGRNVMLIQLQGWSEFVAGMQAGGREVTPMFNTLRDKGLYFNHIIDVTGSGRSADADFAVQTGLLPTSDHPAQLGELSAIHTTLPKMLHRLGYTTALISGERAERLNRDRAFRQYGYDRLLFDYALNTSDTVARSDLRAVVKRTLDQLDRLDDEKWFYLVNFHLPYHYSNYYDTQYNAWDGFPRLSGYLRAVSYGDEVLRELFEAMPEKVLFNTVFILYGDHATELAGKGIENFPGADTAWERLHSVPLLIYIPGMEQSLRMQQKIAPEVTGGLHDVMPTVLHLLGGQAPDGVLGTHLLVNPALRPAVTFPRSPDWVAYAGTVFVEDKPLGVPLLIQPPGFIKVFDDQLIVRDLLRHDFLTTDGLVLADPPL